MTVLWTTTELPGHDWDPEPDPDDDKRTYPLDLQGQGPTRAQLNATRTVPTTGEYL